MMDKEQLENNIQSDVFYYKRRAQKHHLDVIFDRTASKQVISYGG